MRLPPWADAPRTFFGGDMTTWTDERIDQLRACIVAGFSASQIGREIGVTRNAVIGKTSRLGLKLPGQKYNTSEIKAARKKKTERAPRVRFYMPKLKTGLVKVITDTDIPKAQRKTIWQLGPCDCRWPVGEPGARDFFYCGAPALDWGPYCEGHHLRAHAREPEQQRRAA
jgi:GcrA cell cycle regulator